jgi:hypothetical protein
MDVISGSVDQTSSSEAKIALFRSLFRGREDVYPRRFESRKTGRSDVAERRVVDAGRRTSVVHQLAHVAATLPHAHEPAFDERPQFIALRAQPDINRGVVFHRRWEAKDVVHRSSSIAPSVWSAVGLSAVEPAQVSCSRGQ